MQKVFDVKGVCDTLSLSRTTVYRLISAGQFPKGISLSQRRRGWTENMLTKWVEVREAANQ